MRQQRRIKQYIGSIVEMTVQAKILAGRSYRYFEAYCSLAIIYWALTIIVELVFKLIEKKMSIPDEVADVEEILPQEELKLEVSQ